MDYSVHSEDEMETRLHRKTALVTGATSNIGRAIAIAFAREGAHVVLSGRNQTRAAEALRGIHETGGWADFVQSALDGSPATSRKLAESATPLLRGRPAILLHTSRLYTA